jgi:predicted N-formylglutamate amidohydrolase
VRALDAPTKAELVRRYYHPHRDRVEQRIAKLVSRGRTVVHVASHSFTPELDGVARTADVACLYDPERSREKRFCSRWLEELSSLAPDLRLRRNYPYRGRDDGLTRHLRRRFSVTRYLGVELELNQALWFGDRRDWLRIRRSVMTALASAIQSGSNR